MKTRVVMLIVGVMLVSLSAGAADPITLEYWVQQESPKVEEYVKSSIAKFEAANPGITINLTVTPYAQYRDKLLVAIEGGTPPDVFLVDQIWNSEFAAADAIIPLDEYIAEYAINPEDYYPGAWASTEWNGQTWGIPSDLDVWSFTFYNKDMFKAAGLDPENPPILTMDDFLTTCARLTDPDKGQWGLALPGGKSEGTIVVIDKFIYTYGGLITSDDGTTCTMNSPEAIAALEQYKALEQYAPVGVAAAVREDNLALFKNKKVAMFWFPQLGQDSMGDVDFDWGITVSPAPEGKEPIGTLGGWTMVISKDSEYQDAAFKFVAFMTSEEINQGVTSLVPANIAASKQMLKTKKKPDLMLEHLLRAKPRPISPIYPQVSEIQQNMVQNIFTGTPVSEAVETASQQIQDLLEEYF
jgi:ABC-type glycerol-3-phosphate transport system substrate-binding protein